MGQANDAGGSGKKTKIQEEKIKLLFYQNLKMRTDVQIANRIIMEDAVKYPKRES